VDRVLRLGVIGVGALTLRGILPHLSQDDVEDRVRIEALCDPVQDRAEAAAARFGVPRVFAGVDEMLAGADIDAVTVASPIGLHYEHSRAALEAGKHVHANKTMTTSVREADELIALAGQRDLCLVASPGEVLRPQVTRTRELIESGAIGELAWALCGSTFGAYHEDELERRDRSAGAPIDPGWYFRSSGGGPVYDMTVYALHQLTTILGPARAVVALSGIRVRERGFLDVRIPTEVDDNTVLLLDFGDGLFAVAYGTAAGSHTDQFGAGLYFGTRGTIDGLLLNGEPFDFPGRDLMGGAPPSDRMAQMQVLPHVVGAHRGIDESHVFEDIMQLVDCVLDGTPTPVTAEHARHVIDIIESGYRSARTGIRQELTTSFDSTASGSCRRDAVRRRRRSVPAQTTR
jgi:predicted dehydrogenase